MSNNSTAKNIKEIEISKTYGDIIWGSQFLKEVKSVINCEVILREALNIEGASQDIFPPGFVFYRQRFVWVSTNRCLLFIYLHISFIYKFYPQKNQIAYS